MKYGRRTTFNVSYNGDIVCEKETVPQLQEIRTCDSSKNKCDGII